MTSFKKPRINSHLKIVESDFLFNIDSIPEELKKHNQFVLWTIIEGDTKPEKRPVYYTADGYIGASKWGNTEHQHSWEDILEQYNNRPEGIYGIGFILQDDDGIVCIDLDHVENDTDWRFNIIEESQSWAERSLSGKGYHVFVKGDINKAAIDNKTGIELYKGKRFIALTGHSVGADDIVNAQPVLDGLYATVTGEEGVDLEPYEPVGDGGRNNSLFERARECLLRGYTDEQTRSEVYRCNDLELPPYEGDELSGLDSTIQSVIDWYRSRQDAERSLVESYVYIASRNEFYVIARDSYLGIQALNNVHQIEFPGAEVNGRYTPRLSEIIFNSPNARIADKVGWMPTRSKDWKFIEDGTIYCNKYRGLQITPIKGEVDKWLDLLEKNVPDEPNGDGTYNSDQRINLIKWMAYAMRYPDKKCNWSPVIHGPQGSGKDSIFSACGDALGKAQKIISNRDIKGGYDNNLVGTKIGIISELSAIKGDSYERLKLIIAASASDGFNLNVKSEAMVYQKNLYAMVIFSNNIDAIKFDKNERRFYVLNRTSLWGTKEVMDEYFEEFHHWRIENGGNEAILHYLLYEVDLNDFNPQSIPSRTQAMMDMHEVSKNDMETAVDDLINSDIIFKYDYVSCYMVLDAIRVLYPHIKTTVNGVKSELIKNHDYKAIKKPIKRVDGTVLYKSRLWIAKGDAPVHSPSESYVEIEEIEKVVSNAKSETSKTT